MKRTFIAGKNIAPKFPVSFTWLTWLTFRVVDEPGWVTGTVWTIVAILWGAVIVVRATAVYRTPFD